MCTQRQNISISSAVKVGVQKCGLKIDRLVASAGEFLTNDGKEIDRFRRIEMTAHNGAY